MLELFPIVPSDLLFGLVPSDPSISKVFEVILVALGGGGGTRKLECNELTS